MERKGTMGAKALKNLRVLSGLFRTPLLWITLCCLVIWFANAVVYYGLVLLTTKLSTTEVRANFTIIISFNACFRCFWLYVLFAQGGTTALQCEDGAPVIGWSSYTEVLIVSAAELPGLLVAAAVVERIGRKVCCIHTAQHVGAPLPISGADVHRPRLLRRCVVFAAHPTAVRDAACPVVDQPRLHFWHVCAGVAVYARGVPNRSASQWHGTVQRVCTRGWRCGPAAGQLAGGCWLAVVYQVDICVAGDVGGACSFSSASGDQGAEAVLMS